MAEHGGFWIICLTGGLEAWSCRDRAGWPRSADLPPRDLLPRPRPASDPFPARPACGRMRQCDLPLP